MTGFRLLVCLTLLFLCSSAIAAQAGSASEGTLVQLQKENAALQHQVRRLEHQVAAMREELTTPKATQVIGGIGYIVGVFGIAGWLAARKKSRED